MHVYAAATDVNFPKIMKPGNKKTLGGIEIGTIFSSLSNLKIFFTNMTT